MSFLRSTNALLIKEAENLLSKKFGTEVVIHSSEILGGGCINNATKIETNAGPFFMKWNRDCSSDMFLREAEGLEELGKASDSQIVIPEVYAKKEVDNLPGFLIMEYLEPGYGRGSQDEMLGRGLAAIHKYSAEKFGFYNDNYCGSTPQKNSGKESWPVFFRENRLGFLLKLIQKERPLHADETRTYERLLDRIDKLVPADSEPALIHGDLWSGNYMITAAAPALIDPSSYFADREMEFGIMTMFGGFSNRFYSAYNEVYPLPTDWRERNRLYQLYHVLNHYYLFGGGYRNSAHQIAKSYL